IATSQLINRSLFGEHGKARGKQQSIEGMVKRLAAKLGPARFYWLRHLVNRQQTPAVTEAFIELVHPLSPSRLLLLASSASGYPYLPCAGSDGSGTFRLAYRGCQHG